MTDMIDSTWTLAIERADMAGVELAHALAGRLQGTRPVTLVGHSIGARVVYSCLKELYRLKTVEQQKFEADKRAKGVAVAQEDAVEIQDDVVEYANTGVKESNADCDAEPPTRTAKSVIEDNKESGFFSKWRAKLSATTTTTSNSNSKEYGLGDDSVEPPPRFLSKYDGIIQDVVILGAPINSTVSCLLNAMEYCSINKLHCVLHTLPCTDYRAQIGVC